jgi:hypothetical protein
MARIFSHIRAIRFIREIRVKIFALARTLFTHERSFLSTPEMDKISRPAKKSRRPSVARWSSVSF